MYKIPLITPLFDAVKEYIGRLESKNLNQLSPALQTGLEKNLTSDEEIILTLRNYRAKYDAPSWMDSNTYFNSWFILTSQRILILRNSSSFTLFRDISLDEISRINYEMERLEPRISIISPGKEDRIDFFKEALKHCEHFDKKINDAVDKARQRTRSTMDAETIFCFNCGTKIPKISNFCSDCGQLQKS